VSYIYIFANLMLFPVLEPQYDSHTSKHGAEVISAAKHVTHKKMLVITITNEEKHRLPVISFLKDLTSRHFFGSVDCER
jgi:hypothetical protein